MRSAYSGGITTFPVRSIIPCLSFTVIGKSAGREAAPALVALSARRATTTTRAEAHRSARSRTACSSTLTPGTQSSSVQLSCSLCEMPRSQGVKIMAVGATRDT